MGVNCSCVSLCKVLGGTRRTETHRAVPPFLYPYMNKKIYRKPYARMVQFEPFSLLAGSNTGATGENIPWASNRNEERKSIWDEEQF